MDVGSTIETYPEAATAAALFAGVVLLLLVLSPSFVVSASDPDRPPTYAWARIGLTGIIAVGLWYYLTWAR